MDEQLRLEQIQKERSAALKQNAVADSKNVVDSNECQSDVSEEFGEFVKHRVVDAKETTTNSKEVTLENTKKRSRSASISRSETDLQPVKQSRGRSSTRLTSDVTPAFLCKPSASENKEPVVAEPILCPITGLMK